MIQFSDTEATCELNAYHGFEVLDGFLIVPNDAQVGVT